MPVYDKIETIAREIYGADGVDYTAAAKKVLMTLLSSVQIKCLFALQKHNTVFRIIQSFSAGPEASE